MTDKTRKATDAFEKALQESNDTPPENSHYILRLFVSGMTPGSMRAIQNLEEICSTHLDGRYELEIIDIYQQPELSKREQIIAAPTLIKKLPVPLRRFIGDLSDSQKILVGLDLLPKRDAEKAGDRSESSD
jgi:circadian clock protein KaiB